MKKFLSFLALALCFVACQNEAEVNVGNDGIAAVTLNVGVPELATRADQDANKGHDSAFGAIDYFTATEWAKYDLRYILEVYAADDNGSGDPIYKERLEKIVNEYAPVTFDLRLIPNRTYKFVVWADFLTEGSQLDWHYNTTDLNAITLNDFGVMDETYDAYFVSENVEITATGSKSLTLRRPFGKVRVISTDKQYIENYATPTTAKVTYTSTLYKSFNAVNGNIATERQGNELESEYTITGVYELGKDAEADKMTVFAGYFFARDTEDEFNFTLEVFDQYNNPIKSYDFNTQIPVKRNHLTTIEGNILTIQSDITISIDDNFGGETIVDPEIAGIASPEVTATVDGNKVTLAWAAVEGATSYYTRIKGEGNVFEKTTELTKVYENLAWETTYAFEVYAANDNGNTSFTTVVENVAIGEEPVVLTYNIYLKNEDNWEAVYFYAWGDDFKTALWPGEQMTKTTVEEVEYYVYALPAEATGKTINFLFNNGGNGKQTADIKGVVVDQNRFYTNYVEPTPEPEPTDHILYFKPNSNWKVDNARFAAYFFGNGETWANLTLVEGETDIYSVTVPEGYPNIIFCRMNPNATANNWNNKWNQTADLTVPTDGKNFYVVPENAWDGSNAAWSTYTPATPEPVALATPEVKATVEVNVVTLNWDAIEGASHYTVQVDDDVEEVVNGTSYEFTGDYAVEYMFTVKAIAADTTKNTNSEAKVVTVTTEAEPESNVPADGSALSVAEFLAFANTENNYELTGKITRVVNTTYGNFDLTDATGTVYIYGLCSPEGASQYWAESGVREGDTITVKGKYSEYNGDPQVKNAIYVSHIAAPFIQATSVSANADETSASIAVTANVVWLVTCDADWVTSYTESGASNGTIEITMSANESEEDRVATFTLTADGVEPVVVKLTQKGKLAAGEVAGGNDDFSTLTNNNSYGKQTSKDGWVGQNCAVMSGGSNDSNPVFKSMMGTDSSVKGLTMNGKTAAVGTITSPTITTGCGTLKFMYGYPFSESNGIKFKVEIKQNGAVVNTYTIEDKTATKLQAYDYEVEVNISGEFQIVFTNLCPSNNASSNKDRYTIWNVEWTGCN